MAFQTGTIDLDAGAEVTITYWWDGRYIGPQPAFAVPGGRFADFTGFDSFRTTDHTVTTNVHIGFTTYGVTVKNMGTKFTRFFLAGGTLL